MEQGASNDARTPRAEAVVARWKGRQRHVKRPWRTAGGGGRGEKCLVLSEVDRSTFATRNHSATRICKFNGHLLV